MALINMSQCSYMRQYEDKLALVSAGDKERKEYINDAMKVPDAEISKWMSRYISRVILFLQFRLMDVFQVMDICNLTGSRLFVPLNPSHRNFSMPESTMPENVIYTKVMDILMKRI